LSGAVAFDEERADAECARYFVPSEDSAQSRRNDAGNGKVPEKVGEGTAQLFGMLGMFKDQRALDVGAAVASAGKLEVAGADGAYFFEEP
jgi:hypothetical protein